jgi:hypothetical protein
MIEKNENMDFNIRGNNNAAFRHYKLLVKLSHNNKTEHHNIEVLTNGSNQLIEMRRIYTKGYKKIEFRTIYNVMKNN